MRSSGDRRRRAARRPRRGRRGSGPRRRAGRPAAAPAGRASGGCGGGGSKVSWQPEQTTRWIAPTGTEAGSRTRVSAPQAGCRQTTVRTGSPSGGSGKPPLFPPRICGASLRIVGSCMTGIESESGLLYLSGGQRCLSPLADRGAWGTMAGMRGSFLEWAYRRLGRRYPTVFIAVELQAGFLITAGTVLLLSFYYDGSAAEFGEILAITLTLTGLTLLWGFLQIRPKITPRPVVDRRPPRSRLDRARLGGGDRAAARRRPGRDAGADRGRDRPGRGRERGHPRPRLGRDLPDRGRRPDRGRATARSSTT